MVDPQYEDLVRRLADLVDQAIRTSSGGPESDELAAKTISDTFRVIQKDPQHEPDHRGRGLLRQSGQTTFGCRGYDELPSGTGHALLG